MWLGSISEILEAGRGLVAHQTGSLGHPVPSRENSVVAKRKSCVRCNFSVSSFD